MPFQSTVGDYQTVATLETFGFLPPMTYAPDNPNTAYYATHRVYRSNNGGTSWQPISGDLTGGSPAAIRALVVAPSNSQTLYAATNDYFGPPQIGRAKSIDGIAWQPVGNSPILTEENLDGSRALGFADMLYHDGTYYLYFNATKDDATGDIYLAISE